MKLWQKNKFSVGLTTYLPLDFNEDETLHSFNMGGFWTEGKERINNHSDYLFVVDINAVYLCGEHDDFIKYLEWKDYSISNSFRLREQIQGNIFANQNIY